MGVTRGYTLRDKHGREFEANVADCVNVDRTPQLREQIVSGDFHRLPDPAGTGRVTVEKTFFYADFGRKQFFLVLPRWDRHKWREASQDLRDMLAHFPESLTPSEGRKVRVVFGLAELREKLLAYDAELNDDLIEVLKVLLVYEHPFLLQYPRLNLVLDRVSTDAVEFVASYDHDPDRYRLGYRRSLIDELFDRESELKEWVGAVQQAVSLEEESEPLWVNMQRWFPGVWALAKLDQCARQIEAGTFPESDIDSNEFEEMLKRLPRGSELSAAAKRDLHTLRGWAQDRRRARHQSESLTEELWQIYFDKALKGNPVILAPQLVERLWKVLDDLNAGDFEGNSFVDRIHLGVNDRDSFYNPSTDDIGINRSTLPKGQAYERGWFEQVVLHEVGHAVHARHQEDVDEMLRDIFGWQRLPRTARGIDEWIGEMGGYPPDVDVTEVEKRQIRSFIRQAVGDGKKWSAPARPSAPKSHLWHAEGFGPRLACEFTAQREKGKRWYDFSDQWHRHGGRRFFVNYYYGELMIVNESALEYVRNEALDPYALMAPPEFFAELYMTVNAKDPTLAARSEKLDPDLVEYLRTLGKEQVPTRQEAVTASTGRNVGPAGQEARKVETVLSHRL